MNPLELTPAQRAVLERPLGGSLFLHGPYGCGKTTVGLAWMERLLAEGVDGDSLLVLTPQRTLQQPYLQAFEQSNYSGSPLTLATIGGLARRIIDLFWPLAAEKAGFAHPEHPPVFLTLETAQYYMARIVRPLIAEQGFFSSVSIPRQRLYSQILDNLNKAAGVGFSYLEIGERLAAAWAGDPGQKNIFHDVQESANRFRAFCLEHNLLDFSLQLEIFTQILWPHPRVRAWLQTTYRHLIYDNLEEDLPRAHDLIAEWLPDFTSALLIYDEGGGHRQFLAADPHSGWALGNHCDQEQTLNQSFVISPQVHALHQAIDQGWHGESLPSADWQPAIEVLNDRFYPQLLDKVAAFVQALVAEGLPPAEIAILGPYLSDALRFALQYRLQARGLPVRSHRPSRPLHDEPAIRTLLTLAQIAHPTWQASPSAADVAQAFMFALQTDLVRARRLTEIVWRRGQLSPWEKIAPAMQEQLGYALGERYAALRAWLHTYKESQPLPLDLFLRHLFGELLSQPGFGFHRNLDAARLAGHLITSIGKFRLAFAPAQDALASDTPLEALVGREYLQILAEGLIAAQYLPAWENEDAVLLAPAFTFLMMNRPVSVQIWLSPGAPGWSERLFQPLTHPHVLSRNWPAGRLWTDADETAASEALLSRLVSGLLLRCRQKIVLALPELGETGFEERGPLLMRFHGLMQRSTP